jgi:hypothetical protein
LAFTSTGDTPCVWREAGRGCAMGRRPRHAARSLMTRTRSCPLVGGDFRVAAKRATQRVIGLFTFRTGGSGRISMS